MRNVRWSLIAGLSAALAVGCAATPPAYPPQAPLTRDPDRRPFQAELEPYYSPMEGDHLDKTFFMPVARFFAVDPGGDAVNVNALDEVPDSSWFENRIEGLSAEHMVLGACASVAAEPRKPWKVVSGKADGVYPGFVIKDADGQRYLVKFDGGIQAPRGSAADVVGSRIYFAAGFDVPCNSIVHFDRSALTVASDAKIDRADGEEEPMTWRHVDTILTQAMRQPDGRLRAVSSRYLKGRPLGPWRYHGVRDGDRNDIVPHEDRRELRGAKVLAAWTGHWDSREQNTLAMWIETSKGQGFVRHHVLDFGDCFGAFVGRAPVAVRKRGHVHWFDPWQVLADFATLGLVEHPWERATLGPSGPVFGFYDVERFDPETWSTSYPNPAFGRMTERDAAWMARIIARMGEREIDAMVRTGALPKALHDELVRLLVGRRHKVLSRYLSRLSPLARPVFEAARDGTWLCVDDLGVMANVAGTRKYQARAWFGSGLEPIAAPSVQATAPGRACARLPVSREASSTRPQHFIVEMGTQDAPARPYPARFHVYHYGAQRYLLTRVERPEDFDPPS